MAYTKARREANERYNNEHYNKITLRVPAFRRELLEDIVDGTGLSINRYINYAIADYTGIGSRAWYDDEQEFEVNKKCTPYTVPVTFRTNYAGFALITAKAQELHTTLDEMINFALARTSGIDYAVWRGYEQHKRDVATTPQRGDDAEQEQGQDQDQDQDQEQDQEQG